MSIVHRDVWQRSQNKNRTIRLYIKEISRIPLLSAEEEKELGCRAKAGDLVARQKLVEGNLRFAIKIAKKYTRRSDQLMDLINVANIGLVEAARRFDPDRNVRFTSYAIWWIRQAIFHYLAESTYVFRTSPKIATVLYRAAKILDAGLPRELMPDREQLAIAVGAKLDELNNALTVMAGTVSLEEPISEEGGILLRDRLEQKAVPSPERQVIVRSLRNHLDRSIAQLKPMEQTVIRLRFGLGPTAPMTLQQIGDKFQLSRERIRQIESKALKNLQQLRTAKALVHYLS